MNMFSAANSKLISDASLNFVISKTDQIQQYTIVLLCSIKLLQQFCVHYNNFQLLTESSSFSFWRSVVMFFVSLHLRQCRLVDLQTREKTVSASSLVQFPHLPTLYSKQSTLKFATPVFSTAGAKHVWHITLLCIESCHKS